MGYAQMQEKTRLCEYIIEGWDDAKIKPIWAELKAIPKYNRYRYSSSSLISMILENNLEDHYGLHGRPTDQRVRGPYNPFNMEYTSYGNTYFCQKARFGVDFSNGKKTLVYSALAVKNGDVIESFGKHFFAPLYEIQWKVAGGNPMRPKTGSGANCNWEVPLRITRCYNIDRVMNPCGVVEITDFMDER